MATTKQERAQALARSRGFRTVYQMRQFERANKPIGGAKARTVTRDLEQAKDKIRYQRVGQRDLLLAKFGVTVSDFNTRHRANTEWAEKELRRRSKSVRMQQAFLKTPLAHTYETYIYDSVRWTEQKVGYVLSFYAANVNRNTNYQSLFDGSYKEQKDGKLTERALVDTHGNAVRRDPNRTKRMSSEREYFLKMNAAQYYYLTQYTDLMTVSDYDKSYGSQQSASDGNTPVLIALG